MYEYDDFDFDTKEEVFEHILSKAFHLMSLSYNTKVRDEVWGVLDLLGKSKTDNKSIYNTEIASKLKLEPSHVELIQYMICFDNYAEYGTSPRGCWLTEKGLKLYNELLQWKQE